ncbi:MAG: L-fucose:H+ symporter permease [Saprospiraceae bacterium]|nr:L-fucose:H+ symporter permease [Saprospiraceae bacterium]MDW8485015.1 L-fucose:H+ symporter permease [Saprospiraceae bacterium]
MTNESHRNTYWLPFALVCSLFFLWGLANSLNGSLIRHFQFALDLKRWQAGIVDSAFYLGYFIMAIPAGLFMQRFGYKKGILAGLLLYATGGLLFLPAASVRVYGFFLFALFVIASGLAFLETAANLYVTVLGNPKRAEWRINFAQSFNGISIILGPVIGSLFIFSQQEYTPALLATMTPEQIEAARVQEALSVRGPYGVIAGVVLVVALLFGLTHMPEVNQEVEEMQGRTSVWELLRCYRHLTLGILAQFANVGAQATLWGYFVDFKMDFSPSTHLAIAVPYAEFWHSTIKRAFEEMTLEQMAGYHASFALVLFMLGRFAGTYLMSQITPRYVMVGYCLAAVSLVAVALLAGGLVAIACISLVYFCQSIMFPTIFALATKQMAPAEQKLASSLVIMAIVGGAVMPPLAGLLSQWGGMRMALLVPLVCFAYVAFYALWGYRTSPERTIKQM